MEIKDGIKSFYPKSLAEWRAWLETNNATEKSVWLIIYRKESGRPGIFYSEAVDEALCFGWIDSKPNKRDEESFYQFFAHRNPKSNWSKINKDKVARLLEEGRMAKPGLEVVETAKQNGTWSALDLVEALVVPDDLQELLIQNPEAAENFSKFPKSVKRGILEWILNAKGADTRQKRIRETVELAAKNLRANQYTPKK